MSDDICWPKKVATQFNFYHLAALISCLVFLASFTPAAMAKDPFLTTLSGKTMGTQYQIKFYSDSAKPKLQAQIDQALVAFNQEVSTYIDDSEISRFNRAPVGTWFSISEDFYATVQLAKKVHALTEGAFDPTIGSLVNLWGFGPKGIPSSTPKPTDIKKTLVAIGFDKVQLREKPRAIKRLSSQVYLDLSAIAKGYGVDLIARLIESKGIQNYMVEIGGEVRTKGKKANGKPWLIGIERPAALTRQSLKALAPGSKGLATSGDYRNYYEKDGQRITHIIDPRTGMPIKHKLASVSVLADTCAEADALATALMVLGTDASLAIAKKHNLPIFLLVRSKDGFDEKASDAMPTFFVKP